MECPACDCEPGNHCLMCGGTGEIPDYDNPPQECDDDYDDWIDCHPHWSPN